MAALGLYSHPLLEEFQAKSLCMNIAWGWHPFAPNLEILHWCCIILLLPKHAPLNRQARLMQTFWLDVQSLLQIEGEL